MRKLQVHRETTNHPGYLLNPRYEFSQNPRQEPKKKKKKNFLGGYTNERIFKTYSTKTLKHLHEKLILLMEVVR
jgi:hypothetical protein